MKRAAVDSTMSDKRTNVSTCVVKISSDKIGLVIGRQGETIREIQNQTNSTIQLPQRGSYPQSGTPVIVQIAIQGGDVDEAALLIRRASFRKALPPKFDGTEQAGIRMVFIDVLNFVDSHFFVDVEDWSMTPVLERTKALAEACNNTGIELIGFIDSLRTDEALDKWHDRMRRSVLNGTRNVPQNISGIMAALFQKCGLQVRLSTEVNNDDTLAAHAFHSKVPVLSGDKDFLRYITPDGASAAGLELFTDFRVRDGKLLLQPRHSQRIDPSLDSRTICATPPAYQLFGSDEDAWVVNFHRTLSFRGGAPSPLVRALSFNPYLRIRPLRVALYRELLDTQGVILAKVKEEFPVWDGKEVVFPVDEIEVDTTKAKDTEMLGLLNDPKAAFARFFPRELDVRAPGGISDGDWYRHCHGCRVIVIELCCYLPSGGGGASPKRPFLDVLIESDQWAH